MEFVSFWLGASKLGAISALVNTANTGDVLLHSIQISKSKFIICHVSLMPALCDISGQLSRTTKVFVYGENDEKLSWNLTGLSVINFHAELQTSNKLNPENWVDELTLSDQVAVSGLTLNFELFMEWQNCMTRPNFTKHYFPLLMENSIVRPNSWGKFSGAKRQFCNLFLLFKFSAKMLLKCAKLGALIKYKFQSQKYKVSKISLTPHRAANRPTMSCSVHMSN